MTVINFILNRYAVISNYSLRAGCEKCPPYGCLVSTQLLVFPISTRVYQHGKCFTFLKDRLKTRISLESEAKDGKN